MQRLRSELFAELLTTIQGAEDESGAAAPAPPPEALLINDLIREYLSFTGLRHSLQVFNLETSQAAEREALPRQVLASELGVREGSNGRAVPLLYHLVSTARAARLASEGLPIAATVSRGAGADETLGRAARQQHEQQRRATARSAPRGSSAHEEEDDDDSGLPGAITRRTVAGVSTGSSRTTASTGGAAGALSGGGGAGSLIYYGGAR